MKNIVVLLILALIVIGAGWYYKNSGGSFGRIGDFFQGDNNSGAIQNKFQELQQDGGLK